MGEFDRLYQQAIDAYELLIQAYKTPLDIPQNAWIKGKDIEVGKWYLWVQGGESYQISDEISAQQHIIMIPESLNGEGQTAQEFDALWCLQGKNINYFGDNSQLFITDYDPETGVKSYDDKENMQWQSIRVLELELESFGLEGGQNWVIGPLDELDIPLEFINFLNWNSNPLP